MPGQAAVNQTLDVQGFSAAIQSVLFDIHQNAHGNTLSGSRLPILMQLDDTKAVISALSPAKAST